MKTKCLVLVQPVSCHSPEERICQTIVERRARQANKPRKQQHGRNQVCPWISTPVRAERGRAVCELEGTRHVCPASTRRVFIPPRFFFQHCLSSLCGAEILKLHFSDVGSLEVWAWRQVSVGKKKKKKKGEGRGRGRRGDWRKDKEKREESRRDLPLIRRGVEFMPKRLLHVPYMLFSNVNAC